MCIASQDIILLLAWKTIHSIHVDNKQISTDIYLAMDFIRPVPWLMLCGYDIHLS